MNFIRGLNMETKWLYDMWFLLIALLITILYSTTTAKWDIIFWHLPKWSGEFSRRRHLVSTAHSARQWIKVVRNGGDLNWLGRYPDLTPSDLNGKVGFLTIIWGLWNNWVAPYENNHVKITWPILKSGPEIANPFESVNTKRGESFGGWQLLILNDIWKSWYENFSSKMRFFSAFSKYYNMRKEGMSL